MFAGRRLALVGGVAAIWYICILALWALQPLTDSVPVGIDVTLKTPAAVSVEVDCNGVFESASRDDSLLPPLKAQPEGEPALKYQRQPCDLVHHQARIVFILDTLVFVGLMGGLGWFMLRGRRIPVNDNPIDPILAGSSSG
jgi:hypothetical protein